MVQHKQRRLEYEHPIHPFRGLLHPGSKATGRNTAHWQMGPYAPGLPEGTPPHPVQQPGSVRQPLDIPCRPERAGPTAQEILIVQMQSAEGITEALKAADPMGWTQRMNNIQNRAEEIVLRELIYGEETV